MFGDVFKVGLLAVQGDRMLLCRRKKQPQLLILPGGKIEPGESHDQCLRREIEEELGSAVRLSGVCHIGSYSDRSAGDPLKTVHIELYAGNLDGTPVASSEIGELVWFGPEGDLAQLAPSLVNKIIPDLIARGILHWHTG